MRFIDPGQESGWRRPESWQEVREGGVCRLLGKRYVVRSHEDVDEVGHCVLLEDPEGYKLRAACLGELLVEGGGG